eukprot:TRINITY_DN9371_c0_g1_i1.p1 TRINITY_DN9371_c0_g1~~TRINITY_DN9371_c0_g1_i1.p1  ORF type:complete len:492 (+),score=53.77 TRINITY_DN9371_c0_g1_i1:105-1478(+)
MDWSALVALAGRPTPRLYTQKERLFGAKAPLVRLWHDSAAWHPFANQVWLLLEEMQIPHVREPVPLAQYLKPGERISTEFQKLGVSVPAVQVLNRSNSTAPRGDQGWKWSAPLKESSAVDIFRKLHKLFPKYALLPQTPRRRAFAEALMDHYLQLQSALYGTLGGAGSRAHGAYSSAMDAFEGAWSGSPAADFSLARFGDDGDGARERFGGSPLEGPFLFGARPCAVDMLLLPLLERCEANVPHPQIGNAPHLAITRWPSLAQLQAYARTPGVCSYGELSTDAATTVGIRFELFGVTGDDGQLPPLHTISLQRCLASALQSTREARRDAASRLVANYVAVARFASGGAGRGRSRQVQRPAPDEVVISCTQDALRAVAQLLLSDCSASSALEAIAQAAVARLPATYKAATVHSAAMNLVFLAENTGVPRDMTSLPAAAFRAHLQIVAKCMHNVGLSKQ